ncbi:efflux RND transporter permease subunit [Colwellia sp. MEBiC06753]
MIEFFINRPKFAIVLSIVMTLAGILTFLNMPVALYPNVAPPAVQIITIYPGADHNTIRDTVASVLEQEINGVEGMLYMDSKSSNDNMYIGKVTFEIGFDPDVAQNLVQNRVNKAMAKLPATVKQIGVTVQKSSTNQVLAFSLVSPNGTYDDLFLSNYFNINMRDALLRVDGIGEIKVVGEKKYSMRVWLNNERMKTLNIGPAEVSAAIATQNTTLAAGNLGEAPHPKGQVFQYSIKTRGRLQEVEDFENIIVRAQPDGSFVYLKDIAQIELGAHNYSAIAKIGLADAPLTLVYLAPGANTVTVAEETKAVLEQLKQNFPDDIDYILASDSSDFILASMDEVYQTFIEAIILVSLVTYLFLQNWRATVIPLVAIPVSLIATFVVMQAFGMDINTISMFGLILAIGIVVDAAIVVIENVERIMTEQQLPPAEATQKAMKEVTAPLIASALVLMAVFVPVSMAPGMVGILYQQFGIAIVASTFISTIVALTLTPALCALLMRVTPLKKTGILGAFNRFIEKMTIGYGGTVIYLGRRLILSTLIFIGLIGCIVYFAMNTPSGFLPQEDRGGLVIDIALPEASTLERTNKEVDIITKEIQAIPGVEEVASARGFSLLKGALATNTAMMLVKLDHWDKRKTPDLEEQVILKKVEAVLAKRKNINAMAFALPAIPGLGSVSGLTLQLEDTLGRTTESLGPVLQQFIGDLMADPRIMFGISTFTTNVPQQYLDIDYAKAMSMGVSANEINTTLQIMFGKQYVNDYTKFGKNYEVNIMAAPEFRNDEESLETLYARANNGEMVAFSTFAKFNPIVGADSSPRYNLYGTAQIIAIPTPGVSTGEAIEAVTQVASAKLPDGYQFEWTAQTYQEVKTAGGAAALFGLALLFTYLFLVAQYESWLTPFAIILCVPTALLGSFMTSYFFGGTLNLYMQIGLVLMIAMACRNAILIIEFAKVLREDEGLSILESAKKAAQLRMRPVLMTAFSFILGVLPLVLATGAGAAARNSMGQTVFSGMFSATIIGCILVPIFFIMFQKLREQMKGKPEASPADSTS